MLARACVRVSVFGDVGYRNNATVMNAQTALTTTWVGGSVTPLAGLNSGAFLFWWGGRVVG